VANGTGPAVTGQDRVGQALRDLKGSADIRLGVIAGATTLGITCLGSPRTPDDGGCHRGDDGGRGRFRRPSGRPHDRLP